MGPLIWFAIGGLTVGTACVVAVVVYVSRIEWWI